MKKVRLNFLIVPALVFGLLAFTWMDAGGIKGVVLPAEGATQVLAITGTDTLKTDVAGGRFILTNVKKGTYTLQIKARPPYKDTAIVNVPVIDSAVTDVGKIKLQQ